MNEKELKKEIVEIFKKYKSVEDIGTRLIMLGFQKGKLEERERIEDLIIDMRFKIQNKLNNYFNIDTKTLLFIYNKELSQLQKEIGEEKGK